MFVLIVALLVAQGVKIVVLETSDVHGWLLSWDYIHDRRAGWSLAKCYSYIDKVRKHEGNVLLLDAGDTYQGTPLASYYATVDTQTPNPIVLAMNLMGYDGMTIGNHEFNFGTDNIDRWRKEAKFPFLSGNVFRVVGQDTGYYVKPYIVKEFPASPRPVRVGVFGLTTVSVARDEHWENKKGILLTDPVEEARKLVRVLRDSLGCDLVIALIHAGLESESRPYPKNFALTLASQVDGIDLILAGHDHREVCMDTAGVPVLMPLKWGMRVARADFWLSWDGDSWRVAKRSWRVVDVTRERDHPALARLLAPYHERVREWLGVRVAWAEPGFLTDWRTIRMHDTPLWDMVMNAMAWKTGAQIVIQGPLTKHPPVLEWEVRRRDLYGLYIYDNYLYKVRMPGRVIKALLEEGAKAWDWSFGEPTAGQDIPLYAYQEAQGFPYYIDMARPPGQRVVAQLEDTALYTVAINHFAFNHALGSVIPDTTPILGVYGNVRVAIEEYMRAKGTLRPQEELRPNWKVTLGRPYYSAEEAPSPYEYEGIQ